MPRIRRGRGSTQTGTSAPIARATLSSRGSSSLSRLARASRRSAARGIGRAAAQSRRHRQALVQREAAELEAGDFARQAPCAALSTRLLVDRPGRGRGRAAHRERKRPARRKRQPVADAGEHHQAVEQVIAVGAPAEHAQASD